MANYQYVDSTGVIIPDTGDLLTTVQDEYKQAFGEDMPLNPSTPQGILITGETLARDAVVRNNAAVANQINPNVAGGVFLDAIWALTGGQRVAAVRSTVTATLTGVSGTTVPQGSIAATSAGDQFQTISTVTIGMSGSVSANFESVVAGAIPCAAGALTQIVSQVLGWETVTNADAAIVGSGTESDEKSRSRRRNTLGLLGRSLSVSILSAVYAVADVRSAVYRENFSTSAETIDGILIDANSIYVCVDGGLASDIGQALLSSKSGGCGYTGDTTVSVTDATSGQVYSVKFQRPDEIQILVRVTVKSAASISDPESVVVDAIVAYANGELDGEDGLTVGEDVSPFEIGGAVNRANPTIYVRKVEIAVAAITPVFVTTTIPIGLDEVARIQSTAIQVIVV